ncbi:SDR family NAD(P)-dependent oxidoreductase [Krasilnikovia cinnamomea]|nr:SDR family NAD(P)-dependent oxidoreductase [Krasilnikovia cinnamomea]
MDRSVLITGGTGGLGAAVVTAFAQAGWRVVAPVRPGTAARLPAPPEAPSTGVAPGVIEPVDADLGAPDDVAAVVATAAAVAGAPLRAVVNLVGGYASAGLVHETPIEDFEAMLRINLRPTYLVTAAALPHLVATGSGSVVCVSSRAALTPFPGAAGYVTAKAAVLAFANAVAAEYQGRGVRCNTVLPSVIDTAANRAAMPGADRTRWVTPAEIARVILFLADDASAPTSGASIPVYGRA